MLSREMMERKWTKTHVEVAPHCPRCASSNTKFCYYNNYSFSQPRYFCKGCRRYWTKGGSLRNVPVGGGCRKSRRAKSVRDERSSISSNFSKNCDSYNCSNGDMGSENCADIDLAVVFAKFLNQDPSNFQAESSEELISVTINSSTPDSDCQQLTTDADLIIQDSGLFQQLPHDDRHVQVLVSDQEHQEMINEFGFQSLLGDEMVQDALWSEATTTLAKNDTWQPQEFDSLTAADDQPRIPTNLMTDNLWSSFDLSGFEVFSRP